MWTESGPTAAWLPRGCEARRRRSSAPQPPGHHDRRARHTTGPGRRPRLVVWTSTPRTTRASPGSRPARCRWRSPTRRPTPRTILEQAQACHEDGVALAVFPELSLCGYAIDDLLMQDTLLDGVRGGDRRRSSEASADLLPMIVVGAPLVHGTRVLNCAVVIHRGRVLGVAPKSYLPTYREFYERRWFAPGDDRHGASIRLPARRCRSDPTWCSRRPTCPASPCTWRSARTCGCRCRRALRQRSPARRCCCNLSGSPITIARAEDRRLLVRSASARCSAAYLYAAAGQGESTTDLSWDGQTMVYECGDLLAESERFPEGPRRSVVDVDLDRIRQERLRQGTFDDNRRGFEARSTAERFRTVGVRTAAADGRHRAAAQGRPVPVRPRRRRAARAGLLRGLQHPGLRA